MKLLAIIFLMLMLIGGAYAATSASYVVHQPHPSFQAIYSSEDRLNTYWPILGNKETCDAR